MKGTGHGTGPELTRDLGASLAAARLRKVLKKEARIAKKLRKMARHGKRQGDGGEI